MSRLRAGLRTGVLPSAWLTVILNILRSSGGALVHLLLVVSGVVVTTLGLTVAVGGVTGLEGGPSARWSSSRGGERQFDAAHPLTP
ncbi:hypothetical protein [Streptomyces sp. MBT62]|uniref:hypothetical protein n=1 Tax=Streptomyces sp. MBT62 TaxID=2800410 RepID=UPI00190BC813|nr:hypothetical protein [Streptomyces sp. MBT62]MBK3567976.1 hypothetical protein [Streptomyces sp. MBT62]